MVQPGEIHSNIAAIFKADASAALSLPLIETRVPAGFPSPADDHAHPRLDLNKHLIRHPLSTFFIRLEGDSMIE